MLSVALRLGDGGVKGATELLAVGGSRGSAPVGQGGTGSGGDRTGRMRAPTRRKTGRALAELRDLSRLTASILKKRIEKDEGDT